MSTVQSETLAKMRALREAKKLGCSGAHKTDDGLWHPCSSAERLQRIMPNSVAGKQPAILQPAKRRERVGTAKIKKQWEHLGERGIVAIDNIAGGGLVSGVVGKAAIASPRDNDPDVFTDIESARMRSRQLGCIGVSRRISRSGRTIWMPCTNMSDLANRTGRTSLGRRNMQKRRERVILDALKKRERQNARRRVRQKSLLEEMHGKRPTRSREYDTKQMNVGETKKLGSRIGRGLRSAPMGFTFVDVTGAIDADKDGIVFEGKPLERPIIPRFLLPDSIARRIQNSIRGTAEQNEKNRRLSGNNSIGMIDSGELARLAGTNPEELPQQQGDELLNDLRALASRSRRGNVRVQYNMSAVEVLPPLDAGVEFSGRGRKIGARRAKANFEKIDDVGDRYSDYFIGDILDLLEEVVPTSSESLESALKNNPYTKNNWKRVLGRINDATVDWDAQKVLLDSLKEDISNSPLMQSMIREYGLPPIVATARQPDIENLGFLNATLGATPWFETIGGWSGAGFIGLNAGIFPEESSPTGRAKRGMYASVDYKSTARHELAHAWETMAARKGGPARDRYIAQYQEIADGLLGLLEKDDDFAGSYHQAPWGTEAEHRSALRISEYAETARIEWFAEAFAAITSSNPQDRAKVDALAIQNMAAVLGKTPSEFARMSSGLITPYLDVEISARSKRMPINKLFGMPDTTIDDALDFIKDNPQYLPDSPDELLARMSSAAFDVALRDYAASLRSSRYVDPRIASSLAKAEDARKRNELGQKIIDLLMNQATGKNDSPEYPTLWFIGGTTGSGKTTLRNMGVMEGVPGPSTAVDIDPDVIKSLHPDWKNGAGAQNLHRWSTQWTRYGYRQALAQRRDAVLSGTGVRTDQLDAAKASGYLTVGHFVYVPVEQAKANMRKRAGSGGTNLPDWFAGRYASELSDKIPRAITSGNLDEFYLWDNSGSEPKLAAFRTRDGKYQILNRSAFEGFLGKPGARYVEDYWKSQELTPSVPSSQVSSRSSRSLRSGVPGVPRRLFLSGDVRNPRKVTEDDVRPEFSRHSNFFGVNLPPSMPLGDYDWFGSSWEHVDAQGLKLSKPVFFESAYFSSVNLKELTALGGSSFAFSSMRDVDLSRARLDGADFRHATLSKVDFTGASLIGAKLRGAQFRAADFSDADLSSTDLTPDDLIGSGIVWNSGTKFPPLVSDYLKTQQPKKLAAGRFTMPNKHTVSSAYDLSADSYRIRLDTKRTGLGGIPAGPRRMLDAQRSPNKDSFQVQGKTISGADASHRRIPNLVLVDSTISDSRLIRLEARKADIKNTSMVGVDAEGIALPYSKLHYVSLTRSNLVGSNFHEASISGRLSLVGSDLRRARLTNLKVSGVVDVRGADLSDADLMGAPIEKFKWDASTKWFGARVSSTALSRLPENIRKQINSSRSTRFDSRSDAMASILQINDGLSGFSRLNKEDKKLLADEVLSSYRRMLGTVEAIDDINVAIQTNKVRRDSIAARLGNFESIKLPDGETANFVNLVENDNKEQFVSLFNAAKVANRDSFVQTNAIEMWDTLSVDLSGRDSLDVEAESLREERAHLNEALSLSGLLGTITHTSISESEKSEKLQNELPKGKKTGPLGSRSVRERRKLTTDIEDVIQEVSPTDKDIVGREYDSYLDSFYEGRQNKFYLKQRMEEFAFDFQRLVDDMRDGKYDEIPAHELSGLTIPDAIDALEIVVYQDGTHAIVAPPNPILSSVIPDKRDWSTVELPDVKTIDTAIDMLDDSRVDPESSSFKGYDETQDIAWTVGERMLEYINGVLGTIDETNTSREKPFDTAPFIRQYIHLLHNPHDFAGPKNPSTGKRSPREGLISLHDGLGHFAIGRGFDRHGEWAVMLAMLSLLDIEDLNFTDDEKQSYARYVLGRFGATWMQVQAQSVVVDSEEFGRKVFGYGGDIFDILEILDPPSNRMPAAQSSRSLRRIKEPLLEPETAREIAKIEARDRAIKEFIDTKRFRQEEEARRRKPPRFRRKKIQSEEGLAPSGGTISSRSSRPEPKAKPVRATTAAPSSRAKRLLEVDESGRLVPASNKPIGELDVYSITENDLPSNYMPKMPGPMRRLHAQRELAELRNRNRLSVNSDGTLSAKELAINPSTQLPDEHAVARVFSEQRIAGLKDGQFVIVRDIPGGFHSQNMKMAVVARYGSDLVSIELTDDNIQEIESSLKKLKESSTKPLGVHTASLTRQQGIEVFDLSQLADLMPNESYSKGGTTGVSRLLNVVLDYQALTLDTDGDIPRPGIIIKQGRFDGMLTLSDATIAELGGEEAARDSIEGMAFQAAGAITLFNGAKGKMSPFTMVHEWSHMVDMHRSGGKTRKPSETADWIDAASSDAAEGQKLIASDRDLRLAVSENRVKSPVISAGNRITSISDYHSAQVGQKSITRYGRSSLDASLSYEEDFAEAMALYLIDKQYGYILQETDSNGRPIPDGKKWTFAELYPNRAILIEKQVFNNSSNTREMELASNRSSRTPSFDQRFKSLYGKDAPKGDGDCFVSAVQSVDSIIESQPGIEPKNLRVVHGTPLGTGGQAEGIRFPHAWVESAPFDWDEHVAMENEVAEIMQQVNQEINRDRKVQLVERLNELQQMILSNEMQITVYDYSNGNEAVIPRALYYAIGNIDKMDARYYQIEQMKDMMSKSGHYGPWE